MVHKVPWKYWDRGGVARCFFFCLLERAVSLFLGTPVASLNLHLVTTYQTDVLS
jgi:hypothetical protein